MRPEVSVVAPCYNEETCLTEFVARTGRVCEGLGRTFEVVLVNDGSNDRTWPAMQILAEDRPWLVCVNLSRNHGHQLALTAGLSVCRGRRILIIDADLQDPPELLPRMLDVQRDTGADVVYGRRRARRGETAYKRWTAAGFYRLIGRLTDVPIPPDAGDFRLMTRRALRVLLSMPERRRFIRGMVSWIGFTQVPLDYDRDARFAGATHFSTGRMLRFALDAVTSFSTRPLRWPAYAGSAALLGALAVGAWAAVSAIRGGTPIIAAICTLVLLLSGAQLMGVALLGEYLGRLYEQSLQRPLFVIDRIVRGAAQAAAGQEGASPAITIRAKATSLTPMESPARG